MGLEVDLRNYLATDTTISSLCGGWLYFSTAPQDSGNQFITINLLSDDAQHTTASGPGHLAYATVEVTCSVKGTDQYAQYIAASTLADAVKSRLNTLGVNTVTSKAQWPAMMGNTMVYFLAIETTPEVAKSRGTYSLPYQYQEGKGSGIQRKVVPVMLSYWNPYS